MTCICSSTSLGMNGLKKQSSILVSEKVRFPSVVGTISFSELRTSLIEGCIKWNKVSIRMYVCTCICMGAWMLRYNICMQYCVRLK